MRFIFKIFILTFLLTQATQAGRYYHSDYGRFVSRDPIGYVDGMSLYNAYFAEKFALDPQGYETYYFNKKGKKSFKSGIFYWEMYPVRPKRIQVYFQFEPNKNNCCKNIEFIQVVEQLDMRKWEANPNETDFQTPNGVDATGMPSNKDRPPATPTVKTPYYTNAHIDNSKIYKPNYDGLTTDLKKRRTGSGPLGKPAYLDDTPTVPDDYIISFETCAFCVESGEILGCVGWDNANFDLKGTWIREYGVKWAEPRPSDFFNEGVENWNK